MDERQLISLGMVETPFPPWKVRSEELMKSKKVYDSRIFLFLLYANRYKKGTKDRARFFKKGSGAKGPRLRLSHFARIRRTWKSQISALCPANEGVQRNRKHITMFLPGLFIDNTGAVQPG